MRLLIVGCGAIGRTVARAASDMDHVDVLLLHDANEGAAEALAERSGGRVVDLQTGVAEADVVVEAASREAVAAVGPAAFSAGCDLVVVSVGALIDRAVREDLEERAWNAGKRLMVPSGAIAGLDALRAAREGGIDELTLTTTKHPDSLGLGHEELHDPIVVYEGPASEAVERFPKNVNVAAAITLAAGREPHVRVVADPTVTRNAHEVHARGAFGELTVKVENEPFPENPATSHLAALSVVSLLRAFGRSLETG